MTYPPHVIEHAYRAGRRRRSFWSCRCGAERYSRTVAQGFRAAARHMEANT